MYTTRGGLTRKSVAWLTGKSVSELFYVYIFTVQVTVWTQTVVEKSDLLTPVVHCVLCDVEQLNACDT